MRLKIPVVVAVVVAVLLAAAPIQAHHGSTGFDQNRPLHLIGKVSLLEWTNPHVVIHLEVAGADGKVATRLVNTYPPNTAKRLGFSKDSFAAGTEITVNGTSIVFPDGTKIVTPDCFTAGQYCYKPFDGKGNRIQ